MISCDEQHTNNKRKAMATTQQEPVINTKRQKYQIDKTLLKHHIIGAERNNYSPQTSPLHLPQTVCQAMVCSDMSSIEIQQIELDGTHDDISQDNIIHQLTRFGFDENDITSSMEKLGQSLDINLILQSLEDKQTIEQYKAETTW